MADEPILVQVYLTEGCLESGYILPAWAEIAGDVATVHILGSRLPVSGEGTLWHRTRTAAESYARQVQICELESLRARIDRIERYRFGRPGR